MNRPRFLFFLFVLRSFNQPVKEGAEFTIHHSVFNLARADGLPIQNNGGLFAFPENYFYLI
jgi:hypothetical protein